MIGNSLSLPVATYLGVGVNVLILADFMMFYTMACYMPFYIKGNKYAKQN